MTTEEKQIHNVVHVKLQEFDDFVSLVKRMREAQKEFENQPPFKWGDTSVLRRSRELESEVDEYLKKMEL